MSLPAFAELLERLVFSPGRNAKLALLGQWFAGQPDPERGLGLAAITESLKLATAKPAMLREITMAREVWVTHGREDALIHALGLQGIRGRALNLIGRGEEDEEACA